MTFGGSAWGQAPWAGTSQTLHVREAADSAPASDAVVRSAGIFKRGLGEALGSEPGSLTTMPGHSWHIDASDPASDSGTDPILDLAGSTITQNLTVGTREAHDGIPVWNLDAGYMDQAGGTDYVLGQGYTVWAWLDWRDSDVGWRTLHRGNNDHWIIVESGAKRLGMYSNRNGAFRPITPNFNIDPSGWQLVVAVGHGDSPTATTGRTDFYINGEYVGSADRVASGTAHQYIGLSGQGPGRVAEAGTFATTALTPEQVREMFTRSRAKYGLAPSEAVTSPVLALRSTSDTASATDGAARSAGVFKRTASDATSVSEAISSPKTTSAEAGDKGRSTVAPVIAPFARGLVVHLVHPLATVAPVEPIFDRATIKVTSGRYASDAAPATDAPTSLVFAPRDAQDSAASDTSGDAVDSHALADRIIEEVLAEPDASAVRAGVFWREVEGDEGGFEAGDGVDRSGVFARSIGDDAPATDSADANSHQIRDASDSGQQVAPPVPIAPYPRNALGPILRPVFAVFEGNPRFDTARRIIIFIREATDAIPVVSDGTVRRVEYGRAVTDQFVLGDEAEREIALIRDAQDAEAEPGDEATRSLLTPRSAVDALPAVRDSAFQKRTVPHQVEDSAVPGEIIASSVTAFRTAKDTAPADDQPAKEWVYVIRTGTDDARVYDDGYREIFTPRTSSDALDPAQVSADRTQSLHRAGTTDLPEPETFVGPSPEDWQVIASRTAEDEIPVPDDGWASRSQVLLREVGDHAPSAEGGVASSAHHRRSIHDVVETGGVEDTTDRTVVAVRRISLHLPTADAATRRLDWVRGATDALPDPQDDAQRHLSALRGTHEALTGSDALSVFHLHARSAQEVLATLDAARREAAYARALDDIAAAADEVIFDHWVARYAFDSLAAPTDEAIRSATTHRVVPDDASVADSAIRSKRMFREIEDVAEPSDHVLGSTRGFRLAEDGVPVVVDEASHHAIRERRGDSWLPAISDWMDWRTIRPPAGYGPPTATITSVSRMRLGWGADCDSAIVAFAFDRPVDAWAVRVNSTHVFDGQPVAAWVGNGAGPVTSGEVEVAAALLLHGENEVTVYGRTEGQWSHRPVREPVGAG